MERFQSEPFANPFRRETYETFSSDDSRYNSPFDRSVSAEWHECEELPIEYACPEAAKLIDAMNEYWTPRDLRQLASDMRAHAAVCPACQGERKPVESAQLAIPAGGSIRCA